MSKSTKKGSKRKSMETKSGVKAPAKKKTKIMDYLGKNKNIDYESKLNEFMQNIKKNRENYGNTLDDYKIDLTRINTTEYDGIPKNNEMYNGILYWMSRDQRIHDNWAMIYGLYLSNKYKIPFNIVFCLQSTFLNANIRHYNFMLKNLEILSKELIQYNIQFTILYGKPEIEIIKHINNKNSNSNNNNNNNNTNTSGKTILIADFSPLKIHKSWCKNIYKNCKTNNIFMTQIDAHNIVPLWIASNKQEYAARTIRNKINSKLNTYLTPFPQLCNAKYNAKIDSNSLIDWSNIYNNYINVDMSVKEVTFIKPGNDEGFKTLYEFIVDKLPYYNKDRNDPNNDALSNMSAYYHFGQISCQRVALLINEYGKNDDNSKSYLEEMIVRRELSDNFCYYNINYDNINGTVNWAKTTLELHRNDKREYLYNLNDFENYKTHDDLWNAAQKQMVLQGKMHGFLRMYWCKKILEWSNTPENALKYAIYLNDKYSIDGRDPNGYVGIMWSICGIHDQGWRERPIFGKIRYMNYAGCKRKFDVKKFVKKWGC